MNIPDIFEAGSDPRGLLTVEQHGCDLHVFVRGEDEEWMILTRDEAFALRDWLVHQLGKPR